MKPHLRISHQENGKNTLVEVNLDTVIGNCILDLIDSGIDEYMYYRVNWEDISDEELEFALNNTSIMAKAIEYIRLPLLEKLKECLAERKKESSKS